MKKLLTLRSKFLTVKTWRNFIPEKHLNLSREMYKHDFLPNNILCKSLRRSYYRTNTCLSVEFTAADGQGETDDEKHLLEDPEITWIADEDYFLPEDGHNVIILQPNMKVPWKKNHLTTAELQLEEASALIDSLPMWKVVDTFSYSLKHIDKKYVYSKGNFEEITQKVRRTHAKTAVFVNLNMLSGLQLSNLQKAFKVPVYDRFTIVLQIFKTRARTKEAKLQVALAELPYLRSRLHGIHKRTLDKQRGSLGSMGGAGETSLEMKQRYLHDREVKLKRALKVVEDKRELLKKERIRQQIPTVAVVGYTNAGKTSLIKALTGEERMVPLDKLFATLDVTVHAGVLPNKMKVLYVDTVGFISDIPTNLIASFAATLNDMLTADLIVHVRDISHPDEAAQKENVYSTLDNLQISQTLRINIIEVSNKIDKLSRGSEIPENTLPVSATKGIGLDVLRESIQNVLVATTGRLKKTLRISQGGTQLSWLHKEATVERMDVDPDDAEYLIVTAIFTEAEWGRFISTFSRVKKQKT